MRSDVKTRAMVDDDEMEEEDEDEDGLAQVLMVRGDEAVGGGIEDEQCPGCSSKSASLSN